MKSLTASLIVVVLLISSCCGKSITISRLNNCDLLFHIPPSDNAITEVTNGIDGHGIDHVAIFFRNKDANRNSSDYVIEAIGKNVKITPINDFISREGSVVAGIIKAKIDRKETLNNAFSKLGLPYDSLYLPNNEAIYCSELVQQSYVDTEGKLLFTPIPMTFRNSNGEIPDYWTSFYQRNNMEVPEGKAGSNPGELSRRETIKIKRLSIK